MSNPMLQTKLVTYAEYKRFEADDNFIYELLNGELVKKSAPSPQHQMVLRNLVRQMDAFVVGKKLGDILFAPVDVFLDTYNAPQPDLVFVSNANRRLITADGIMGAPDIVVEIVSPSSIIRDRIDKMKLYQRFRIPEYWMIDPNNQSVEVYALSDTGEYDAHSFAATEGEFRSKLLADFVLKLTDIFPAEK